MSKDKNNKQKDTHGVSGTAYVDAIYRKFPFLKYFSRESVKSVSFHPINADVLAISSSYNALIPWKIQNKIALFSKDGDHIGTVGVKPIHVSEGFFLWKRTRAENYLFQETIAEAMERLYATGRTFFIVGVLGNEREVRIACPKKGQSIQQIITEEEKSAEKALEQEVCTLEIVEYGGQR